MPETQGKKRKLDFFAEETAFEMPMSQMIDCVFLLLIFFMSVSTIEDARYSKKVELPVAKNAAAEEDESNRAVIDLEWDEAQYNVVLKMGGSVFYEPRELVPLLETFSRRHPVEGRVVIRADRNVPYESTERLPGAEEMVARWVARNDCPGPREDDLARDYDLSVAGDETHPSRWTGCADDTTVELWRMQGSGHSPGFLPAFGDAMVEWLLDHARPPADAARE